MKKNLSPSKILKDYIERHEDKDILEIFFHLNKDDDLDDGFLKIYSIIYNLYTNNKLDAFVDKNEKIELLKNSDNLTKQYKEDLNEVICFEENHRPLFRCFKRRFEPRI